MLVCGNFDLTSTGATDRIVKKEFPSNRKCSRSRDMRMMERETALQMMLENNAALKAHDRMLIPK